MVSRRDILIGSLCAVAHPSFAYAASDDRVNSIIKSLAPIGGQTNAGGYAAGKREAVTVDDRVIYIDFARAIDFEVFFEFDSDRLTEQAKDTIDELAAALTSSELADYSYLIAGHTDAVGKASYNKRLSRRRAASVRRYLIENFPIHSDRLVSIGFGFERLKDPDNPRAAINRRVEVALIVP